PFNAVLQEAADVYLVECRKARSHSEVGKIGVGSKSDAGTVRRHPRTICIPGPEQALLFLEPGLDLAKISHPELGGLFQRLNRESAAGLVSDKLKAFASIADFGRMLGDGAGPTANYQTRDFLPCSLIDEDTAEIAGNLADGEGLGIQFYALARPVANGHWYL